MYSLRYYLVKKPLIMSQEFPGSRFKLSQMVAETSGTRTTQNLLYVIYGKEKQLGHSSFPRVDQFTGSSMATQCTNLFVYTPNLK